MKLTVFHAPTMAIFRPEVIIGKNVVNGLNTRDCAIIINNKKKTSVTAYVVIADENIQFQYSFPDTGRKIIEHGLNKIIILNQYQRDRLCVETYKEYDFTIIKTKNPFRHISALVKQPDIYLKLAIIIAIVSLIIGLTGVILSIASFLFCICV